MQFGSRVKGHYATWRYKMHAGPMPRCDVTFAQLGDLLLFKSSCGATKTKYQRKKKVTAAARSLSVIHVERKGAHAIDDASVPSRTLAFVGEHICGMSRGRVTPVSLQLLAMPMESPL